MHRPSRGPAAEPLQTGSSVHKFQVRNTLVPNTGSSLAPQLSLNRDGMVSKTTASSTLGYLVVMTTSSVGEKANCFLLSANRSKETLKAALRSIVYGFLSTVGKGDEVFKIIRQSSQIRLQAWHFVMLTIPVTLMLRDSSRPLQIQSLWSHKHIFAHTPIHITKNRQGRTM